MIRRPPRSTLFPYPPLSRSEDGDQRERRPKRGQLPCREAAPFDGRTARREQDGGRHNFGSGGHGSEEYRSEEHTSELQSRLHLVCRLLLEKKQQQLITHHTT